MRFVFGLLSFMEKITAYLQGKGYGAGTVRAEVDAVANFLGSDPALCVDIGGNVGNYSAELQRRFPNCEIHIFEPSSVNLAKLRGRFECDRITICPYAVSSSEGSATLYADSPGSGLASLSKRNMAHHGKTFEFEEPIETIVFQDYWKQFLGERPIDLVKLDIEGHELDALSGFGEALKNIKIIQFEFGGCNIDSRTYFRDFFEFFNATGFSLFRISPVGLCHVNRHREADEFFSTTNWLAVNNALTHTPSR